ncbi:nose resistant to fluoxetine protein 6-like isoform X2 [Cimex lectularius]|uniref:Nose resistant-to-fluoxetine protein N-terminal domain-containing protein n=1 Tax=Cimex lectularius TaxID=79782 RepID=A0A8I6RJH2_CIMLE|nr:nose resistant to fluoxetine protein 6-like isoform X2 [Cimex lectularius]
MYCKIYYLIFALASVVAVHPIEKKPETNDAFSIKQVVPQEKIWVKQLITRALLEFVPRGVDPNSLCTEHGRAYVNDLGRLSLWAVQMADATSAGPNGLVTGNIYQLGSFDQCVQIDVPEHDIKGRYFMGRLHFAPTSTEYPTFFNDVKEVFELQGQNSSIWETFKHNTDKRTIDMNVAQFAICAPHSCMEEDVKTSLEATLSSYKYEIQVDVTVNKLFTYSRADLEKSGYPIGFYIFVGTTVILVCLVTLSTVYELWCCRLEDTPIGKDSWHSHFSIIRNLRKLVNPSVGEFSSLCGLKVLSMFVIIYGHRWMTTVFGPLSNLVEVELNSRRFLWTIMTNGAIVVNTFLIITGFLTYYKVLKDVNNKVNYNVFKYIYRRWVRLTPAYAYVMAFGVFIFPHLELGPMARHVIWRNYCDQYWWTHILYVNNYVNTDKQCLIPSWYMAVDVQLYIFCSVLGYVLYKHRNTGIAILLVSAVVAFVVPGLQVIINRYESVTVFYVRNFEFWFGDKQFIDTYMHFEARALSYIIGMFGAYVYYTAKPKKIKFTQKTLYLITVVMNFAQTVALLAPWFLYLPGKPYSIVGHFMYAVTHKILWGIPICWFIVISSLTNFPPLKLIGTKPFRILNQLNYSALLVHTPVQLFLAGMQRSPAYFSPVLSIWNFIGDLVFSYLVALFLYLFVEAPLAWFQDCKFDCFKTVRC